MFPEGDDPRVIEAARRLKEERLVEPVLSHRTRRRASNASPGRIRRACGDYAASLSSAPRRKGVTGTEAAAMACRPLYFASLMVAYWTTRDGSIGGCVNTTAETVRAALHAIGPAPESTRFPARF